LIEKKPNDYKELEKKDPTIHKEIEDNRNKIQTSIREIDRKTYLLIPGRDTLDRQVQIVKDREKEGRKAILESNQGADRNSPRIGNVDRVRIVEDPPIQMNPRGMPPPAIR